MKKLAMFLGCGVVAFAIGCGGESAPPTATQTAPAMDPNMMKEMQKGGGEVKPGDAAADPAATTAPADDKPKEDEPKKDEPKKDEPKEDKPKEDAPKKTE